MSLLIKRIILFILIIPVLFACEDPKDIGKDLQPQNQNFGVLFTEDITVQTSTVMVDSVRTSNSRYLLAGRYQDPKLGIITAQSFFQVRLGSSLDLGSAPVLDSIVLILDYEYKYGNTGQVQTLNVHRLEDSIRLKTYYNYEKLSYSPDVAGSQSFIASTKRDTLTIKLDNVLGNSLINLSGTAQTDSSFRKAFYGLTLTGGATDNGTIIGPTVSDITGANSYTRIRLYYRNSSSTEQKTYDFFMDGYNFNYIQSDRSGTVVSGLQNPYDAIASSSTNEEAFIQAGIGLMTKIEFPDIQKLKEKGNVGINNTELIITPVPESVVSAITPPLALVLYQLGTDNKIYQNGTDGYVPFLRDFPQSGTVLQNANATVYNTIKKDAYSFAISQYVQDLLDNPSAINGMYLSVPSVATQLTGSSFERSVDRLVLGSNKHPTTPIKLKIYYTLANN